MRKNVPESSSQQGFSLIELLIVVAIIVIMAAVAMPNIAGYLRNYKVRGAAQEVAGEIQQARMKAITQNVNTGITFAIVDADSYRWVSDDAQARGDNPYLGTLHDLPTNLRFDVATAGANSIRFNRLGTACVPLAPNCGPLFPLDFWAATELGRAATGPVTPPGDPTYIQPVGAIWVVTVRSQITSLARQIRIEPGGRVSSQQ